MMGQSNLTCVQADSLVDVRDVFIDPALPQEERVRSYIQQIKDPYHFKVGAVTVTVSYSQESVSLNDRFVEMLSLLE